MIILIIGIIMICISLHLFYKANKIQVDKYAQIQDQQKKIDQLQSIIYHKIEQKQFLQNKIAIQVAKVQQQLEKNKELQSQYCTLQKQLDNQILEKKNSLKELYEEFENNSKKAYQNYENILEDIYQKKEKQINADIKEKQKLRESLNSKLNQIKSVYQAAAAARLRQQKEQDKLKFYRICISEKQINDIINLQNWKLKLYDPTIVAKVIWSSYIMKPTSEMCQRVLGTSDSVCGIYKLTNKQTGEMYIGQSVNIADRWKQHVKCGLGIDASVTNKLYNNMQHTGVWNFTFEVLEKCSRDKLNEKEKFWIEMYQSNKTGGLNGTKGGS